MKREILNTLTFIEKVNKIYNFRFDYSKVNFISLTKKVIIICKVHGEFLINPCSHIKGHYCELCKKEEHNNKQEKEFIKKANKIHNNNYDYSKVKYKGNNVKITIICPQHGNFLQNPNNHLKSGCPICSKERSSKNQSFSLEEFIEKSNEKHNNKYDYSLVEYINAKSKIKIICPIHGEFFQCAGDHLQGRGCRKCGSKISSEKQILPLEVFVYRLKKVFGEKFEYSDYKNNKSKVKLYCNDCNSFIEVLPYNVLRDGCSICNKKEILKKYTTTFVERANKVHDNLYEYPYTEPFKSDTHIPILCKKHGIFTQQANSHLLGAGCPVCKESKGEREIRKFLNEKNIKFENQKTFNNLKYKLPLFFDFYLPDYNLCIEYHGEQHYRFVKIFHKTQENFEICKKRDEIKKDFCIKNNISFFIISYLDIKNIKNILSEKLKLFSDS